MIRPEWMPYLKDLLDTMPTDGWALHVHAFHGRNLLRRTMRDPLRDRQCPLSSINDANIGQWYETSLERHYPWGFVQEVLKATDDLDGHDAHLRKMLLVRAGIKG